MRLKLVLLLGTYLVGSIPFGYLYSRFVEGVDVRSQGSGNIGATNVLRNFGWLPGVSVLFLDALKGALPVYLAITLLPGDHLTWIMVGAAAILGHVLSIFLYFEGGKGVATSAGVFAVLTPEALVIALAVFAPVVGLTRYMSAGSLTGALTLPLVAGYFLEPTDPIVLGGWVLTVMVYWQHRENIKRLIRGEEEPFF